MKIPSTFLYDLVCKLTKSEKRYIKVRSGSGEKDYIQLMDALIVQKKFDAAVEEKERLKDSTEVYETLAHEEGIKADAFRAKAAKEKKDKEAALAATENRALHI